MKCELCNKKVRVVYSMYYQGNRVKVCGNCYRKVMENDTK